MWELQYLDADNWKKITITPSGDAAKTAARWHQIRRKTLERYRILDPAGNTWLYGRPKMTLRGLRIEWGAR